MFDHLTITQAVRYGLFMLLGIPFAILAVWSGGWWHRDYGLPWRRRPGSNGKSIVDGVVTAVLALIALVALIGAQVGLLRGAWWVVATTNAMVGLLVILAWALVFAVWYERHKRGRTPVIFVRGEDWVRNRITRFERMRVFVVMAPDPDPEIIAWIDESLADMREHLARS